MTQPLDVPNEPEPVGLAKTEATPAAPRLGLTKLDELAASAFVKGNRISRAYRVPGGEAEEAQADPSARRRLRSRSD